MYLTTAVIAVLLIDRNTNSMVSLAKVKYEACTVASLVIYLHMNEFFL
jgi:hypothetical protein